jgi:hypothetical protein
MPRRNRWTLARTSGRPSRPVPTEPSSRYAAISSRSAPGPRRRGRGAWRARRPGHRPPGVRPAPAAARRAPGSAPGRGPGHGASPRRRAGRAGGWQARRGREGRPAGRRPRRGEGATVGRRPGRGRAGAQSPPRRSPLARRRRRTGPRRTQPPGRGRPAGRPRRHPRRRSRTGRRRRARRWPGRRGSGAGAPGRRSRAERSLVGVDLVEHQVAVAVVAEQLAVLAPGQDVLEHRVVGERRVGRGPLQAAALLLLGRAGVDAVRKADPSAGHLQPVALVVDQGVHRVDDDRIDARLLRPLLLAPGEHGGSGTPRSCRSRYRSRPRCGGPSRAAGRPAPGDRRGRRAAGSPRAAQAACPRSRQGRPGARRSSAAAAR